MQQLFNENSKKKTIKRKRQKNIETDRNLQGKIEKDRKRQKHIEKDRKRQKYTELHIVTYTKINIYEAY